MHLKDCEIYLFGSYLKNPLDANDIDILLVIPDLLKIEEIYKEINNLNKKSPENSVHIIIYTIDEYKNEENKFSFANVKTRINLDEFTRLYKVHLKKLKLDGIQCSYLSKS